MINVHDLACDPSRLAHKVGRRQSHEVVDTRAKVIDGHAQREMGSRRREDVAPVEDMAYLGQPVGGVVEVDGLGMVPCFLQMIEYIAEDTVIWRHEEGAAAPHSYRAAVGAYTWIYYHHVSGALGEELVCPAQHVGRVSYALGRNIMAQVDDHRLGVNAQDDPLYHPDIAIFHAEVGREREQAVSALGHRQFRVPNSR